jgi:hypothetical protein
MVVVKVEELGKVVTLAVSEVRKGGGGSSKAGWWTKTPLNAIEDGQGGAACRKGAGGGPSEGALGGGRGRFCVGFLRHTWRMRL